MRSTAPSTASSSDQQQSSGPPPNNPFLSYYREFEERTPFVTRASMIVMIICYLLSFVFDAAMFLGNTPYFTIFSFEIYRLVTSPFVGNSIITLLLIALFFPTMGTKFETSMGSAAFLFLMGTLTLVTNVVFVMSCFLLNLLGLVEAIFYNCSGFWVVLFGLITVECMQTPDEPRRFLMIPVDIPAKLFPLLLYAIFILLGGFSGSLFLSFGVAIGVGFFYSQGWFDKLKPTSNYLSSLEVAGGPLHSLSRSKGWILAGAAIGHDAWIAQHSQTAGAGAGAPSSSWSGGANTGSAGGAGGETRAANPFGGTGYRLSAGSGGGGGTTPLGAPNTTHGGSGGGWLSSAFFAAAPSSSSSSSSTGGLGGSSSAAARGDRPLGSSSSSSSSSSSADREAMAARRVATFGMMGQGRSSNGDREQQESLLGARGTSSDHMGDPNQSGGVSDLQRLQVSGGVNPNKQPSLLGPNNFSIRGSGQTSVGYGATAVTTTQPSSSVAVRGGGASADRELIAARRLAALGVTSTTTTSTTTTNTTTDK